MPVAFPMSMSLSMSMDLRFGNLIDAMQNIEDAVREFGREPITVDKIGIRGSRIPNIRPRKGGKTRKMKSDDIPTSVEVECDDYPCAYTATPEEAFKTAEVDEKHTKTPKSGKDSKDVKASEGAKGSKKVKKEKMVSRKDNNKLVKRQGDARLLSPHFDTFGRDA
jgi:hypothetical protein